ncbi:MAG: holo-ACP synthase [Synergistetes bacterium]|nr:holo-ACP synthase [Synergistota bacterium]
MVSGIGVDIVKVARIASLKELDTFLKRIFTDVEIEYIIGRKKCSIQTIAGMFAAKEAFFKAEGGIVGFRWKDVEVVHGGNGVPSIRYKRKPLCKYHLSISHDGEYAVAVVIKEEISMKRGARSEDSGC